MVEIYIRGMQSSECQTLHQQRKILCQEHSGARPGIPTPSLWTDPSSRVHVPACALADFRLLPPCQSVSASGPPLVMIQFHFFFGARARNQSVQLGAQECYNSFT